MSVVLKTPLVIANDADLVRVLREGFWPISPDVVIEVKSKSDRFAATIEKIETFIARGAVYGVAIDPATREVVELGTAPPDLALDFDAIIDA